MTDRAERLLAHAWRRAKHRLVTSEGFIEDALAAALEDQQVWSALIRHLGWERHGVPESAPELRTQHAGDFGRTDIELCWPGTAAPILILELKVQGPPSVEQVAAYLGRDTAVRLVGVAAWSNEAALRAALAPELAERLIGVATWTQLRQLACAEPPLVLRLLQHLIEEMGVAVPRVDRQQLATLAGTLPAWQACDSWIISGLTAVRQVWVEAGLPASSLRSPQQHDNNGWYAGQFDVPLTTRDRAQLWVGLSLADPDLRPLRADLPDLIVQFELDTGLPFNDRLRNDPVLTERLRSWAAASGPDEVRSAPHILGEWEILSTRISSDHLLALPDQREGFTAWAREAVTAWQEHGILERLAALTNATGDPVR